jgi:hypothetical protein
MRPFEMSPDPGRGAASQPDLLRLVRLPALIQQLLVPRRHGYLLRLGTKILPDGLHDLKILSKGQLPDFCDADDVPTVRGWQQMTKSSANAQVRHRDLTHTEIP